MFLLERYIHAAVQSIKLARVNQLNFSRFPIELALEIAFRTVEDDPVPFLPRLTNMPFEICVQFFTLIVHVTIVFPRGARMVRRIEEGSAVKGLPPFLTYNGFGLNSFKGAKSDLSRLGRGRGVLTRIKNNRKL